MYPEEFIYFPLYNQKEITSNLIPVEQPWCKNLIVEDIIIKKNEFRHKRSDYYGNKKAPRLGV